MNPSAPTEAARLGGVPLRDAIHRPSGALADAERADQADRVAVKLLENLAM